MIFGIGSAFSKGPGSAFSQDPGPGPSPLNKACCRPCHLNRHHATVIKCNKLSKAKHHERLATKLNHPKAAPETYWSILKTFANG